MVNYVFYLVHHTVLEEPDPDSPGTHGGHLSPQTLRPVVSDHRHFIAFFKTKTHHPKTEILHIVVIVLPGKGDPDAELLFPHRHLILAVFFALRDKELWNCEVLGYFDPGLLHLHPYLLVEYKSSSPRYALTTSGFF